MARRAVDIQGQTLAGVYVAERAPSDYLGARWTVRHGCGHEEVVRGIQLRASERTGAQRRCFVCRPKHSPIGLSAAAMRG